MARDANAGGRTALMAAKHGAHGNPPDVRRLIRRQLAKSRAAWQQPARVVRTLRVRRGAVVADVGAGPGYFTERLARAVGPRGRVYAVDPEPAVLAVLLERLDGAGNVTPVLSRDDDPMLPPASCDLAVIVNAYHHFANGPSFLRRVARCLKRGGRLVNIDWAYRETAKGPPMHRRVPPAKIVAAARRAGLRPIARYDFLPHQDFLVFARTR
jgi:ubiquinone/menaquinone biosynthesis C-methylase UbiE